MQMLPTCSGTSEGSGILEEETHHQSRLINSFIQHASINHLLCARPWGHTPGQEDTVSVLDIPRATLRLSPWFRGQEVTCQGFQAPLWLPVGFGPLEATVGDEKWAGREGEVLFFKFHPCWTTTGHLHLS